MSREEGIWHGGLELAHHGEEDGRRAGGTPWALDMLSRATADAKPAAPQCGEGAVPCQAS